MHCDNGATLNFTSARGAAVGSCKSLIKVSWEAARCATVEGRVFLELNNPTDVTRIEPALKDFPNE